MTKEKLDEYNKIQGRIEELEEEIYALVDAKGCTANLKERIVKTFGVTKHKNYQHECTIKLSLVDIRILQDVRQQELNALREIISD